MNKQSIYYRIVMSVLSGNVWEEYKVAPAAKSVHHNLVGGLLMHSVSVASTAKFLGEQYGLNTDLLVAGGLLHDIGKLKELKHDYKGNIDYTKLGVGLGHITLGISMVISVANKLGYSLEDNEEVFLLVHLIASHHGKLEWGSPVVSCIPDADVLHFADNIDAKVYNKMSQLENMDIGESKMSYMGNIYKTTDIK